MIEIDGKCYLPAAFRSFRPTPANVSLFYRNGVRLFQMQCSGINNRLNIPYSTYGGAWVGDHEYDFSVVDKQMQMFMKFAPDGYFMMMAVLDMPEWWRKKYCCDNYSFTRLGEACFEQKWIEDACDYLKAFITYTEEHYGDRIFGYSFAAGRSNEWFDGHSTPLEKKAAAFREYMGDEGVHIPTEADIKDKSLPLLHTQDSVMFNYNRFASTLTPSLILRFASAAQEVLEHKKITGLFFGYSMLPVGWQTSTATTGYEKVWQSDDIDMIFAPAEYYDARLADGVSTYQGAIDSLALHNKLYLHEIDHRTYLATYPLETGFIMSSDYKTEEETVRVLRRELCAVAAKGAALWWFDFIGGYYASPGLEKEIKQQMQILERLSSLKRESAAQIAVFVDPSSYHYMKDHSSIAHDVAAATRDTLNRCGAPYDIFNQNDLPYVDRDKYKMFVFLNALEMSEDVKRTVKSLCDKTVVWIYAPNRFGGGSDEVCSIKLKEKSDPDAKIEYCGKTFGFSGPTLPMFEVDDDAAEVVARYEDGTVGCAKKDNQYYVATPKLTPKLWRDIARSAGVHIYTEDEGALYADSRFVAYQTMNGGDIELTLPFDCTLEELFDGGEYKTKNCRLRYTEKDGRTKMFLIKNK